MTAESDVRYLAIPTEIAEAVRRRHRDPTYGYPAHTETAAGYGPCRHCLRYFEVGQENRILFTYDPFGGMDLPLPGPIFIHERPCPRYPPDGGFPSDLREHPLTLVAYGASREVKKEVIVRDGRAEPVIERLLARDDVYYVHVRDTDAGCYDLRAERLADADMSTGTMSC